MCSLPTSSDPSQSAQMEMSAYNQALRAYFKEVLKERRRDAAELKRLWQVAQDIYAAEGPGDPAAPQAFDAWNGELPLRGRGSETSLSEPYVALLKSRDAEHCKPEPDQERLKDLQEVMDLIGNFAAEYEPWFVEVHQSKVWSFTETYAKLLKLRNAEFLKPKPDQIRLNSLRSALDFLAEQAAKHEPEFAERWCAIEHADHRNHAHSGFAGAEAHGPMVQLQSFLGNVMQWVSGLFARRSRVGLEQKNR